MENQNKVSPLVVLLEQDDDPPGAIALMVGVMIADDEIDRAEAMIEQDRRTEMARRQVIRK